MTGPQDPEDETPGDEVTAGDPHGPSDASSLEEKMWRSIVDNYGDRPDLVEPEIVVPPSLRDLDAPSPAPSDEDVEQAGPDPEDRFIPPPPPPLPTPPPARLLAWIGLFGVPTFVLVALVAGLDLAAWVGLILMAWFVGGFVFLVASMRPRPGDEYDDGARL